MVIHINCFCNCKRSYLGQEFMIDGFSELTSIDLFYHTISNYKYQFLRFFCPLITFFFLFISSSVLLLSKSSKNFFKVAELLLSDFIVTVYFKCILLSKIDRTQNHTNRTQSRTQNHKNSLCCKFCYEKSYLFTQNDWSKIIVIIIIIIIIIIVIIITIITIINNNKMLS